MPIKILVTDRLSLEALAFLRAQPNFEVTQSKTPNPTKQELHQVQGLVIRSRTKIDTDLLEQASRLKVIVSATNGFDHLNLDELTNRGLTVMHTPTGNYISAAELTIGLLLACVKKIVPAAQQMKEGHWDRTALMGYELSGKSLGLIGLGRVGQRVAQIAKGFGLTVNAYDPYLDPSDFQSSQVQQLGLVELLKSSEILSLHVPYTKKTHHFLNKNTIGELPQGAILINTSRGPVINESDLVDAIHHGHLLGAALDVFEHEPLCRQSRLHNLSNVVLTPHIGALTVEAFGRVSQLAAEKIKAYFSENQVSDPLPPKSSWYEDAKSFAKN